ncbi:hypothetical protein JCM10207_008241 [Rhodosporidiobolus poonsookiae]
MSGPCCVQGYIHEGTPVGSIDPSTKAYVTLPSGDYDKTKALLFLTDIFGPELPNGQLLADSYAKNGLATYMPDMTDGEPFKKENLNFGQHKRTEWSARHGKERTRATIDRVIAQLKEQGVTKFAAIGYCWGARYVVDLVLEDIASVGITAHASLIEVPKDIEALDKKPAHFLWLHALQDTRMTADIQKQVKELLKDNKMHKHIDFDAGHGFAIRGDPSDAKVRAEADRAFDEAVSFLKEHL